jgi:hypothetical protein
MSYQIDSNEPSELILRARNAAGCALQEQFSKHGGKIPEQRDFKWIKAELTWPSFDHLTFAYGNQVFLVLVELVDGSRSLLAPEESDRCLNACYENNLVPCAFPVDARMLQPTSAGWNLVHLADRRSLDPVALAGDHRIEMSEWEVRNFCIQVVRGHIEEKMGSKVLSCCDVIGIDPQIWFVDQAGNRSWVIVRHFPTIKGNENDEWIGFEKTNPSLKQFDGYLAALSLASSEPVVYDRDGNLVPLSERFSGNAPLYRGDGFYIKLDGLQRIFVS